MPPLAMLGDQAPFAQDPEVLRDGGAADRKLGRQLLDRTASRPQAHEDLSTDGVGQGSEGGSRIGIHMDTYHTPAPPQPTLRYVTK